jgi:glycerophosphoryl diester phosphodiesterase
MSNAAEAARGKSTDMIVIGHRGAPHEALENSWSAFERAIEGGAERIELDVQLTKDGELAVIHDENLLRTAGMDKVIAELTRNQVERHKLINGEQIPFIDDVINEILGRVELNIEIKGDTIYEAERVAELVLASPHSEKVIISSFQRQPLDYLAQNYSELKLACLWGPYTWWPNIAHFAPPVFMQSVSAKIFHPWVGFINAQMMDEARRRGWTVYAYAGLLGPDERIDRESLWTKLLSLGVHGLCTNYPRELKAWLGTDQASLLRGSTT